MNQKLMVELTESINNLTKVINKTKDDRLMTAKEISEEFGIGYDTVCDIFKESKLPVQDYTKPFKVLRSEFLKYLSVRHPNLNRKN